MFLVGVLAASLAAFVGCETKSRPGGPGAAQTTTRRTVGGEPTTAPVNRAATFKLAVPSTATMLKQGEAKDVTIDVDRGKEVKEDITLKFSTDDKGVSVTPETHTVKASDADTKVKVTVKADSTAAIGDHKVTVEATAQSGPPTSESFTVSVQGK